MKHRIRKLSERQILFCYFYVELDGFGAPAARRAGYASSGSRVRACKLRKLTRIKEKIEQINAEFIQKTPETLQEFHEWDRKHSNGELEAELRNKAKADMTLMNENL